MLTARSLRLRFAISRRRRSARALMLVLPLAAAAACSDAGLTSPSALAPSASAPAFKKSGQGTSSAPTTQTFVYDGKALKQSFGDGHEIDFTPAAVCDPATSGYGPTLWDAPCTTLKKPITFTVTSTRDANGRPQITFSPDVRFAPNSNVTMYLNDNPGQGKKATVVWCSPLVNGCVDESQTDKQLKSWVAQGKVARRLKHFSGYNVIFGIDDDGSSNGM